MRLCVRGSKDFFIDVAIRHFAGFLVVILMILFRRPESPSRLNLGFYVITFFF